MPRKYFKNPYEDYDPAKHNVGGTFKVDEILVKDLVTEYVSRILRETKKENYKLRGDLYVGEAGIAFMFLRMSKSRVLKDLFPCLEHAHFYIKRAKDIISRKSNQPSCELLCGNAGIHAVSTIIFRALGDLDTSNKDLSLFLKGISICKSPKYEADEILVGRAGYLSGVYWLNQNIDPKPVGDEHILAMCSTIVHRGQQYSQANKHPMPLMYEYYESDYLGAAHGVSSILHMLLESPLFKKEDNQLSNVAETELIRASVDCFLGIQDAEGNFPTRFYDSDKNLVHWCHGCAGAIYVLAKAFLIFEDTKYLSACVKCADLIWRKGLLYKGPGICHGIAGNAYAFLLMYRLTNDTQYLYQAAKFMEFLATPTFEQEARTPDRPYSLYEGLSGTICFLADILEPEKAAFPFMDVFDVKY